MSEKYKGKTINDKRMKELRINYENWKNERRTAKSPFFIIYSNFKNGILNNISGGALKLYLYLGFHVNTFTGECWISTETIADYFEVDRRTVKKWIDELEQLRLIERIQTGYMRVANTFLLPYGEEEK